ncbi:MAG: 4Fe-4S cluster-binding domain-containing protein [Bacteroidales bacterium]|nr:4Fe-4S cluster-binding domain-containing protein [Bacteroidales bacterium]
MLKSIIYTSEEENLLKHCRLCPRECGTNRLKGECGFCNLDSRIAIASVCNHKGEEPVVNGEKGICNVFFSHCNLQCVYCQNYQISNRLSNVNYTSAETIVDKITAVLQESENIVGFVSPTSQIPQMLSIIRALRERNLQPLIVYNTNSYDRVEMLKRLEGTINVYLADMRYAFSDLGYSLSGVKDYPEKAIAAIKEMYRQKGSSILTDKWDKIESGLIIRVLCLPQMQQNSMRILDLIAENLSCNVQISLLAQYYPPFAMADEALNHRLSQQEYAEIVNYAIDLGFSKIITQELSSADTFQPDFTKNKPFETVL